MAKKKPGKPGHSSRARLPSGFNKLGMRELPVKFENIMMHHFTENKRVPHPVMDMMPRAPHYVAEVRVIIDLEDGRHFSKVVEIALEDSDLED